MRVVEHVLGQEAFDLLRQAADSGERLAPTAAGLAGDEGRAGKQVEFVDVLEGDPRHVLADGAGVLAHAGDGVDHGTRIAGVRGEESADVALGGVVRPVEALEQVGGTGDVDQRAPAEGQPQGEVHDQVGVHRDQPRGRVRAFEMATEPVDPFSDPRQDVGAHCSSTTQVSLLPPPWDELTTMEPLRIATRVSPPVVT